MRDHSNIIFLHGLEGTSRGVKATLLRSQFPGLLTPDFQGSLSERMAVLQPLLSQKSGWIIIGSSFGGLMAAIYSLNYPSVVKRLILLAPALIWPEFLALIPKAVNDIEELCIVPTLVYHGTQDEIIPLQPVRLIAEKVFENLEFREVDDDHGLYKTVHEIDWEKIIFP